MYAKIRELADRVRAASRITVLTGAGVSAASGIPTFRGSEGLWRSFSPQQLATPEAFRNDPRLVWEWYNWRRELISRCSPNIAHEVLSAWSRRYPGFTLITQNVDGLHEKAGTRNVIRYHGSIWEVGCWDRCTASPGRWSDFRVPLPEVPARCPHCGGLARPGVVWFGEGIDPEVVDKSSAAAHCDIFIAVGTSALVYPAAGLVYEANEAGAFTVEINPEATPASSRVDLLIPARAEEVFAKLEAALSERSPAEVPDES